MSDDTTATTTTTTTTTTEAPAVTRYAALVRGRYYDYDGLVWDRENGAEVHPVTEAQEQYLRETAYDRKTVDGEEQRLPKFEFTDTPPEHAESYLGSTDDEHDTKPVRRRTRVRA